MAKRKRTANSSFTNRNNNSKPASASTPVYSFDNLVTSNSLEFVTALLLLFGKLTVDTIELGRKGGIAVTLIGEFPKGKENSKVNQLASFLKQNGDMTMDEVFSALKKRLSE